MDLAESPPNPRASSVLAARVGDVLGVAILYFALARLGLSLASATRQVTALWPPTGLAVAALVLRGRRVAIGIWLGAFFANALSQETRLVAAGIATGNTVAPLLAAYLLSRAADFQAGLRRLRDVFALTFLGAVIPMTVSASIGLLCLVRGGVVPWARASSVWWVWWAGDTLGVLLVTPLILTWITRPRVEWRGWQAVEAGVLTASVLIVGRLVLSGPPTLQLEYLVFPLVIWASLRFGPREIATLVGIISGLAVWEAIHGRGPFAIGSQEERLLFLELFMSVAVVIAFTLSALSVERRTAEADLEGQNQALLDANLKLKEVDTLKANFMAMLIHDLRSPLAGVGLLLDLIKEGEPPTPHLLAQAEANFTQVRGLLDEMLELHRSEQNPTLLEVRALEAGPWLEEIAATFGPRAARAGLAFQATLPEGLPEIQGDRGKLDRVLHNLLDNAIKFTPPGGAIRLEAGLDQGSGVEAGLTFLRIGVSDTGRGIPPDKLPFIFDPFRQAQRGDAARGFGLGLAIVQRLIAAHQGQIRAQSQPGFGTSFTILLPC